MNFFVFILIFFSSILRSQDSLKYEGVIRSDGGFLKYSIEFKKTDTILNGFSITDKGGEHETKNIITGFYDVKEKSIGQFCLASMTNKSV